MAEAWSITSVTPLLAAPLEAARRLRQGAAEVASEPQPPRQPYANAAAHRLLLGALLLSMTGVVALALRVEPSSEVPGRGTPPAHENNRARSQTGSSSTPSDARGSKSDTVVSAAAGGAAAEARAKRKPHLVLMTVDDLGFNDIGRVARAPPPGRSRWHATPHRTSLVPAARAGTRAPTS